MAETGRGVDPTGETVAARPAGAGPRPGPPAADGTSAAPGGGDPLLGQTFAHFRIEKKLGAGGMGDVYLATDTALERPVALKVLSTPVAEDEHIRQRFLREARAQARIQHPNVCHIYYTGEQHGRLFFAMEYVDGESLQERLAREGKLPVAEAIHLGRMAALGLREAHRMGFTHRDIKPSNLMVDRNGMLKVVDFGIVKEAAHDGDARPAAAPMTAEKGLLLGTPHYMAPEQAKGEPIDFRSDIYALGCTLHHLIAGQPPFSAVNTLGIVSKHLSDARPPIEPREARRGTSPVDELLDRMMAKRPADRFASYDDLVAAMEAASPAFNRPAGLAVRSFAVAVDFVVIWLMSLPLGRLVPQTYAFLAVAAAYSIVAHGRWGRTLGKALLEIEVVPSGHAGRVGWGPAALRWVVEWAFTSAGIVAVEIADRPGTAEENDTRRMAIVAAVAVVALAPPVVGGLMTGVSTRKRAVWDKVAGTQVRYRRVPGRIP